MKAKATLILVPLILIAFVTFTWNYTFVEFVPLKLVEGRRNQLVPAPELLTSRYLERVKALLLFYGERFRTNSEGRLLIPRKLANDRDLIWNYSKKAQEDNLMPQFQTELKSTNASP